MKDRVFWKVIAVGAVLGLFAIAYGLCRNNQVPVFSFSSPAYAADVTPQRTALRFENLSSDFQPGQISRAKVVGGWLVMSDVSSHSPNGTESRSASITFYPDPKHEWNGGNLK